MLGVSCLAPVDGGLKDHAPVPRSLAEEDEKLTERLLERAPAGREEDVRWLARSQGVSDERLEELWRGTWARLRPERSSV